MKQKFLIYCIVLITVIGLLAGTSCKRKSQEDPEMQGPAGFRIILSGTADPATLYVPAAEPAVSTLITVTARNNDGTPVAGKQIIFQTGSYGYLDNYQVSDVRTTSAGGTAQITFFIPPMANIKATATTYVTATLVEDGRLDSVHGQVTDSIPVRIIPYAEQGFIIHGHVWTPAGNGVGEVSIVAEGADGNGSALAVTRPSGSYEFYVGSGWYGTITPEAEGYTFIPSVITITDANPVMQDRYYQDFTAVFAGGNNLATDVGTWDNISPNGDTLSVSVYNVTGDSGISYIVIPDAEWIHVSPSTGVTPGSFTITVDANTTGEDRAGTITVSATDTASSETTININQLGNEAGSGATLAADRTSISADSAGGTETVNIFNSGSADDIDFIVTPNDSWLTVSETSGTTDTDIDITIAANSGSARTGTITLTATTTGVGNPTVTITVNQDAGGSLEANPNFRSVLAAGETFTVDITNPSTSDSLIWTRTNSDTWISATPTSGSTPGQLSVTVDPNGTGIARSGVITVTAGSATATITINQNG